MVDLRVQTQVQTQVQVPGRALLHAHALLRPLPLPLEAQRIRRPRRPRAARPRQLPPPLPLRACISEPLSCASDMGGVQGKGETARLTRRESKRCCQTWERCLQRKSETDGPKAAADFAIHSTCTLAAHVRTAHSTGWSTFAGSLRVWRFGGDELSSLQAPATKSSPYKVNITNRNPSGYATHTHHHRHTGRGRNTDVRPPRARLVFFLASDSSVIRQLAVTRTRRERWAKTT